LIGPPKHAPKRLAIVSRRLGERAGLCQAAEDKARREPVDQFSNWMALSNPMADPPASSKKGIALTPIGR
ncbi:MAG: hypothetical protein KJN81_07100, partial [Acidimicrobiia bacterium]|nr:hypothetical protein [Acidimicrobiia bacterium]